MIRDITLGQYYPAKSVLHRMDPRAKLVGTLVFIISVFVFHTFPGYAVATLFLAGMIIISKVPPKFMFKGLKAIVMLLMITVVFNILAVGNLSCNRRRPETCRKNGYPPDLSCDWFFRYDTDNHAKSAYRRFGTSAQTTE